MVVLLGVVGASCSVGASWRGGCSVGGRGGAGCSAEIIVFF